MTFTTLVLVGPHSAGKTTLGRELAAVLGWRFDDEIGKQLRLEVLARDPQAHAMLSQEAFDEEVFRREWDRDQTAVGPRIVETWHPGNLAYASLRSPAVARRWTPRLERLDSARVIVQPLTITRATARKRLNEPGPEREALLDFFAHVADTTLEIARELGLRILPAIATDSHAPQVLAREVMGRLEAIDREASAQAKRSRVPSREAPQLLPTSVSVRTCR